MISIFGSNSVIESADKFSENGLEDAVDFAQGGPVVDMFVRSKDPRRHARGAGATMLPACRRPTVTAGSSDLDLGNRVGMLADQVACAHIAADRRQRREEPARPQDRIAALALDPGRHGDQLAARIAASAGKKRRGSRIVRAPRSAGR
jgi:hypothetical protein